MCKNFGFVRENENDELMIIRVFKKSPEIDLGFCFLELQLFNNGWNGCTMFYTEEEHKKYNELIVKDEIFKLLFIQKKSL